ncbi:tRNA (adenosine(37)-N6)-threonylcarbamoyltransferase complex ATPase subunit type 1 TsaE [Alkalihalophilus pseudofirmus]|uniref:tRNA (adenosine(37)-N6)-threonylcarbamoyltransferase complex ATPase subunit type 1 TsaE n=1 Tax=Alkalihalophilus pseudofirmus TaxID=79885 RepID=UPI00259B09D1|nr:tRNA (adenosine(37)-N6)-threonylcarbamoyltransferase complex ATPase subunit type 1 TsaE [Alkalihalophilus pseudofirmus]WEG17214.1 tRNA (adenosine(37)-N6)-threonylcarbamoyltransferase complex ATPase subunit type 1 TsaE [Alkalihalophilus pseudofirmus]
MDKWTIKTTSPEETAQLAERVGELVQAGDVLTLEGDLGAGKTSFTKGLAKGLGVTRVVSSPTFTIIKEYKGRIPLYHMDVYRLDEGAEELGLEEYFEGEGVSVIEWASIIREQLPNDRLDIVITHAGDTTRELSFFASGIRYEQLSKELATWATH